jgi:hypothetical protein
MDFCDFGGVIGIGVVFEAVFWGLLSNYGIGREMIY